MGVLGLWRRLWGGCLPGSELDRIWDSGGGRGREVIEGGCLPWAPWQARDGRTPESECLPKTILTG